MGKNINELIANEELEEAAAILYDKLRFMLNDYAPSVQLSAEEFAKVAPKLVEKLQNPTDGEPKEPTPEPGDDIELAPAKAYLSIEFKGPEEDTAFKAPKPVNQAYNVGAKYSYTVPTVKGYKADKTSISGTMTAEGANETVTYSKADAE